MESGGKPATIDAGVLLALVVARSSGGFLLRIGVQRREVEDPRGGEENGCRITHL